MSLSYLKSVFQAIELLDSISIQLLRITNGKDNTHYFAREINIQPEEELTTFISEICRKYCKELEAAEPIDDYKGDIIKGNIYKLSLDDDLIEEYVRALEVAIVDPSTEGDIVMRTWNALLIKGKVALNDEEQQVILISMRSPVSVLTNKFLFSGKDRFKKLSEPVLTLNKNFDAVIINGFFYMLTMQAENLFNMERSYRLRCNTKIEEITTLGILTNIDAFKNVATKGQNPRRFVSFNQRRLDAIKDVENRKKYMNMFKIAMRGDEIDTEVDKASERLVKFLCEKAMLDPVDEKPREVAGAKVWT